jgi:hypothetical protein
MNHKLNIKLYTKELQERFAFNFHCGNSYIDQFIRNPISLDNSFGKTYVYLSDKEDIMIGFYNLGVGYVESVKNNQTYKIGGAVHINEFALDSKFHSVLISYDKDGRKINLSDILLNDCLDRIKNIREDTLGYAFVTLCSTEEGRSLYLRSNFEDLDDALNFSIENTEEKCSQMMLWIDQDIV